MNEVEVEVGRIAFSFEDPVKSKTLEIDITAHINQTLNFVRLALLLDKNFMAARCRTEAEFSLFVNGDRKFKQEFESKMPVYISEHKWLIA